MTQEQRDALRQLHEKAVRPNGVWQYGVSGLAGIISYDQEDVVCAIPITTADMGRYPGPGAYGECKEADLAIAAVNALPTLLDAADEAARLLRIVENLEEQKQQVTAARDRYALECTRLRGEANSIILEMSASCVKRLAKFHEVAKAELERSEAAHRATLVEFNDGLAKTEANIRHAHAVIKDLRAALADARVVCEWFLEPKYADQWSSQPTKVTDAARRFLASISST